MEENKKNSIDDIVSGVHKALESGSLSDGETKVEFIEEDSDAPLLVFFEEDTQDDAAEVKVEENSADFKYENESSSVSFEVSEEPEREEAKAWTAYVPRFTEASEKYRMKGQSAPTVSEKVQVEKEIPEREVDPTSESEDKALFKATVVTSCEQEESLDSSTMFKFDSEEDIPAEETAKQEETLDEILDIIDESLNADESEEKEASVEEILEDTEAVSDSLESEPYEIPDPEKENMAVGNDGDTNLPIPPSAAQTLEMFDETDKPKSRDGGEYKSFSDTDGFLDKFIDGITSVRVRLIAAAILALALLVIENVALFGIDLVELMNFHGIGGAMAIITLPFVVGIFALALPEALGAVVAVTKKRFPPEIMLPISFVITCVYYVLVIAYSATDNYALVGFLFAITAFSSILATYFKKKADFVAFKLVSSSGEKLVVDRKLTRNLNLENMALDGKVETYKSRTARVFKTQFVSDFVGRASAYSENSKNNLIMISISLSLAVVSAAVAFFIPGGIVPAAMTFATVFMISAPVMMVLTHKLPFYHATEEVNSEKCAVIGEKSFYDYASIDVITFEDTEVFTKEDVNLQRVMVYGKQENLPKALHQMSALFSVVGGPLAFIFANALDRRVTPANEVTVELNGVFGKVGDVSVMAGSAEFMEKHGIKMPELSAQDTSVLSTTRIMYAAEDGEIYAKFYIRYMLSEEISMLLPSLIDEKIRPLVYTRDPNIDEELLRALTAGSDSITVLKKQNLPSEEISLYRKIGLGLVGNGDKINLINAILTSKKYMSFQTKFAITELIAMIVGAVLALVVVVCKLSAISSAILGIWHIAWCVAVFLLGKHTFSFQKDNGKNTENKKENI